MRLRSLVVFVLLAASVSGCARVRAVRTLRKGQLEVSWTDGGPIVTGVNGRTAVFPLNSPELAVRYGVNGDLDVHGAVHAVPFAFGTFWIDLGASYQFVSGKIGLLGTATLNIATNGRDIMIAPQVTFVASVEASRVFTPYVAWDSALSLTPSVQYLGIFSVGTQIAIGNVRIWPEVRWFAPWDDQEPTTFSYLSPGRGAIGVGLGIGGVIR